MQQFDVVVIGGGPGGYVAAIRASQLKLSVALVEDMHLGGICLNFGCIPTKALLKSAEMLRLARALTEYGIEASDITFDLAKMVERSRKVSNQLSLGIKTLLKKNKVTIFEGRAFINSNKIVSIKGHAQQTELKCNNIIIATGARAKVLPGYEPDGQLVWTYKEAMTPVALPKSLIIVGSGAIGIEFASFYSTLGSKITVVEAQDRILPAEDQEIADFAKTEFAKQGIEFITSAKLGKLSKNNNSVTLEIEAPKALLTADRIIMAVGIVGNIENIGLENTKINTNHQHITTNQYMQTDEPGIYAIGDVAGSPWLAHKASHEGVIAAEMIAGLKPRSIVYNNIPGCTYSAPQVASIGMAEKAAIAAGYKIKIGRFPFAGNGKAIALGEQSGMVKTIFDERTGELLGCHMVGHEVTELIQGLAIAKNMEASELDFIHTIFPHPTLSEMIHESVLHAYGRAIHI
jgi:dihydrolipoamide dehydrogenase